MGYNGAMPGGAVAATLRDSSFYATVRDYIELTKPRITWLILMSTGIGYFFGARDGWHWLVLLHTIVGTGLIASGTAALNQWYERDADAQMNRTQAAPDSFGPHRSCQGLLVCGGAVGAGLCRVVAGGEPAHGAARGLYAADLPVPLHADEAEVVACDHHRRDPGRHAADDRLCGCERAP